MRLPCRPSDSAFDRLDSSVQCREVLPFDKPPDNSRQMPFRQQGLQIARPQFQLGSVGYQYPHSPGRLGFLLGQRPRGNGKLIE